MSITPLGNYALVEQVKQEAKTSFGILLPNLNEESPMMGTIVALGPKIKSPLKPQTKIIFKKYSPDEIEMNGKHYLIMTEDDILAIINE